MRNGIEASEKAEYYRNKAEGVGKAGVSSDDPDAVDKLTEKVAKLEALQTRMVEANKLVRKFKNDQAAGCVALQEAGFTAEQAQGLFKPDFCGRIGFADYQLTNNSANIRRIKERIQQLGKAEERETSEKEIGEVRIVQNAEANRVQIFFASKPAEAIRDELKRRGFRWSPMEGAWQRHLNNSGIYWAEDFARWYEQQGATTATV